MTIKSLEVDGNTYVIGDVHGNLGALRKAMLDIPCDATKLFLGDLINKGECSVNVLAYVLTMPNTHILMGNHEQMFIDWILYQRSSAKQFLLQAGGKWIFDYHDQESLVRYAKDLESRCHYALEVSYSGLSLGLVHASVTDNDWKKMKGKFPSGKRGLLWDEGVFRRYEQSGKETKIQGVDGVVLGHIPVKEPTTIGNSVYIDTGSYNNGKISAPSIDHIVELLGLAIVKPSAFQRIKKRLINYFEKISK